jgi:hypothetical protein
MNLRIFIAESNYHISIYGFPHQIFSEFCSCLLSVKVIRGLSDQEARKAIVKLPTATVIAAQAAGNPA